jgi:hypothetical protein
MRMDSVETKSLSDFEIKDADRGEVTAVVSVFNVVDRDGDVILPGAIKDGTAVKISAYGHDVILKGEPPVGRGVIRIVGDRAVMEGRYFMSTPRGRDAFAQVKEMGADSEWSIGFPKNVQTKQMTDEWRGQGARRLIAGMAPIESSPVFIGANQFTSTVGVKSVETEAAEGVDAETIARIAEEVAVKMAADRKAAEEAAAETKRVTEEAAAKAAADAELARKAAEQEIVTKEFEKMQRTMRRVTA